MMGKVSRIFSLSLADYRILIFSYVFLPFSAALVSIRGYNGARRFLEYFLPDSDDAGSEDSLQKAIRVAYLVNGAAKYNLFRANCLHKSLVVWFLLRRSKLDPVIRFGVKDEPIVESSLHAHAWVEYRGVNLIDPAYLQKQYLAFE